MTNAPESDRRAGGDPSPPHGRRECDRWRVELENRIDGLSAQMDGNTRTTETTAAQVAEIREDTQIIREATQTAAALWRMLTRAGRLLLWLAKRVAIIAAAVSAAYVALDHMITHDMGAMLRKVFRLP